MADGALPAIVEMLRSESEMVQQEVAWAVVNISVSSNNEAALISSGVLAPLVHLLSVPNVIVQEQPAMTI